LGSLISSHIVRELLLPELGPRFGFIGKTATGVPVPVTPVDEHNGLKSGEDQIGTTG
jgi:hypothetical protein